MSRLVGKMYHPTTKQPVKIYEGFSWSCFFLGAIWYIVKRMWKWAIISIIICFFTGCIAWFFFAFFNNKQYIKYLIEKGYLPDKNTKDYLLLHGLINEQYPCIDETPTKERQSSEIVVQYESDKQVSSTPKGVPNSKSRFCPYCGSEIRSGFQFCPSCGQKLDLLFQTEVLPEETLSIEKQEFHQEVTAKEKHEEDQLQELQRKSECSKDNRNFPFSLKVLIISVMLALTLTPVIFFILGERKTSYDETANVTDPLLSYPISHIFDYFGSTPTDAENIIGSPERIIEGEWEKSEYGNYVKYIRYVYPDVTLYYVAVNDSYQKPEANYFDKIFLSDIEFKSPAYSVLGLRVGDRGKKYVIKKLKHYDVILDDSGTTEQDTLIFSEGSLQYVIFKFNDQEVVTKIWACSDE